MVFAFSVALLLLRLLQASCDSPTTSPVPSIKTLIGQLNRLPTDAKAWRRLGKLQLDAQEYAESSRIFRMGSHYCPDDDGLRHHVRVWEAFHGDTTTTSGGDDDLLLEIPPLQHPSTTTNIGNVFLTLDCAEVPDPVKRWKGKLPPKERTRLLHASRSPILSRQACQYLIETATAVAETRGWTKDRHLQAPTCDIPAHDLPLPAQTWIRRAFENVLFQLIQEAFGDQLDLADLRMQDCFVVRYDGEDGPGFTDLMPHEDESLISLTIVLNDCDEYEGGGLYVAPTQDLLDGPAGTVLCFAGSLVHGGYPVSKGTRWILTAFLYCDANASGKKPGYTLKKLKIDDNSASEH